MYEDNETGEWSAATICSESRWQVGGEAEEVEACSGEQRNETGGEVEVVKGHESTRHSAQERWRRVRAEGYQHEGSL